MGLDPFTGGALLLGAGGLSRIAQQGAALGNQAQLQKSRDALELAERRRDQQDVLQTALAGQNVSFAASGADPASGSALGLAQAAERQSTRNLSLLDADAALRRASYADAGTDRLDSLLQ